MGPSSYILSWILTFLEINLLLCQPDLGSQISLPLRAETVQTLILGPGEVVSLSTPEVQPPNLYVMVQFHAQRWNLTLSSSPDFVSTLSKSGTNVGMVVPLNNTSRDRRQNFYLRSSNATANITAVGVLHFLKEYDPVPGGCNEVFNLERDPNVEVSFSTGRTNLFFQWANQASVEEQSCEATQIQKNLYYDVYVLSLDPTTLSEDDFLEAIKKMLTVSSIEDHSHKVATLHNGLTDKPLLSVTSEFSRGVVYSVVARMSDKGLSAPYTAAVTYACNFERGDCSVTLSATEIILTVVCFLCGGFLLLFGHRMFKTSQFIFGYIFTFILIYELFRISQVTDQTDTLISAGGLGVVGGALWLLVWYLFAFPIASVFVPGLCAGYLLAATVFFTPFADIEWWEANENYALAFVCICLLYTILLMAYSKFLNIMSCSIVGAYMLLMVAAIPLHSSLCLIITYSLHRHTLEDFEQVKVVIPTLTSDIVLMVFWPVLVIFGNILQLYMHKGKPDFEFPRRKQKKRTSWKRETRPLYAGDDDNDEGGFQGGQNTSDERRRLIPGNEQQNGSSSNYQTVDDFPVEGRTARRKERIF